jgi:hypothetical protein
MYPAEHGPETALMTLGQYPEGTAFRVIDDIDQCLLLFVGDPRNLTDPFDPKHLHVALWHEDVYALYRAGNVGSLLGRSASQAMRAREDNLLDLARRNSRPWMCASIEQIAAELEAERAAARASEDPENFFAMDWIEQEQARVDAVLMMHVDGIRVTPTGFAALRALLLSRVADMHPAIRERVQALVAIHRWDTAVREACVLLETRIKTTTQSQLYGARLIEQFTAELAPRIIAAQLKVLRAELRTAFRFIRNDFMHNTRVLQEDQCIAILMRLSEVFNWLDAAALRTS